MARADLVSYQLEVLVEAACQYEIVMQLLWAVHDLHNGRELADCHANLMSSASIAALLAKLERQRKGIDLVES